MSELKAMHIGVAFSPSTMLVRSILESDTVIHVENIDVFPPSPNFATIGIDANAETIEYSLVGEGVLSGCKRGVEGNAKAWDAGELIARNFTDMDYTALTENVETVHSDIIASTAAAKTYTDTATQALQTQIDLLPEKSVLHEAVLIASNWTGNGVPYTQTLTLDGVTETSVQEILLSLSASKEEIVCAQKANLQDGGQSVGSFTLSAWGEKPEINIPVKVIVRRDL